MRKNLLSRVNLENDGNEGENGGVDGSLEITQEVVIDAVVAANEGDEIVTETVALESAFINLNNIVTLAANLEDEGVEPDVVAQQVAPAAIEVIATIDEGVAEEAETEAQIALESEDKKSVWTTIKTKAREIWEAIKKSAAKFWTWLKSMFGNLAATGKKLEAAAAELSKRISAATNFTETKMEVRSNWTINNSIPSVKDITAAINGVEASKSRKFAFDKIAELNAEVAGKLAGVKDSADRIAQVESSMNTLTTDSLVKAMANESKGLVGFAFKEGKIVASKVDGGQIETGSKTDLLALTKSARRSAVSLGGMDAAMTRAQNGAKAIEAEIDKLLAAKEVDPQVAKEYRSLVNKTATFITTGMKIIKDVVGEKGIRSVSNSLSFASAALKAATAEKKAA